MYAQSTHKTIEEQITEMIDPEAKKSSIIGEDIGNDREKFRELIKSILRRF